MEIKTMTGNKMWTLEIMDDDGVSTTEEFDEQPSKADIREACESSVEGGDWGNEGGRVSIRWTLTDKDGDDVDSGRVEIDIPPDHEALIEEAIKYDSDAQARCCGLDPDDHDWTSEGEGGCDSNPGVWATGGTSMSFAHHCRACGLHRIKHTTGSQSNPGDHDTVEYDMPDEWCDNCESDDHNTADCEN